MSEHLNGATRNGAALIAPGIAVRKPTPQDGPAVSELVASCPPLDENSRYCNLLQCTDFADTCALADTGEKPVGWVSGYRPPNEPSTLFIWQVAVHPDARGLGLGKTLILDILQRDACAEVEALRTTVTPDNHASRGMFRSLANALDADLMEQVHFDSERHFRHLHDSENLITIAGIDAAGI
jgi:L-2,4-diaminobutyric acid acetyltransferase